MRLTFNGAPIELPPVAGRATVRDVLAAAGMADLRGVAVALDEEVVPRSDWERHPVSEGQRVEVVRATQGGA